MRKRTRGRQTDRQTRTKTERGQRDRKREKKRERELDRQTKTETERGQRDR